jgi:hypothetical protein
MIMLIIIIDKNPSFMDYCMLKYLIDKFNPLNLLYCKEYDECMLIIDKMADLVNKLLYH